jgi:sialidase-1
LKRAEFIREPGLIIRHTHEWDFIGPDVIDMRTGEWWMFTHWGRNPTNFVSNEEKKEDPYVILISRDEGKTWTDKVHLSMEKNFDGFISDGGTSLLRWENGSVVYIVHRHGALYGGTGSHGIPVIAITNDSGKNWSKLCPIDNIEDECYVMNQRLIQLSSGRLVLPVSFRDPDISHEAYLEGGSPSIGRCYISDDNGHNFRLAAGIVRQKTQRGVQEPCVAEIGENNLIMLFRSGRGCHQICFSEDGGETWSEPNSTTLTAACSPLTLTTMPDTRLLVVYNHATPLFEECYYPRNPLVYAISEDKGTSWSEPVIIDDTPGLQFIYPCVKYTREGMLVVYSAHYDHGDGSFIFPKDHEKVGGCFSCIVKGA